MGKDYPHKSAKLVSQFVRNFAIIHLGLFPGYLAPRIIRDSIGRGHCYFMKAPKTPLPTDVIRASTAKPVALRLSAPGSRIFRNPRGISARSRREIRGWTPNWPNFRHFREWYYAGKFGLKCKMINIQANYCQFNPTTLLVPTHFGESPGQLCQSWGKYFCGTWRNIFVALGEIFLWHLAKYFCGIWRSSQSPPRLPGNHVS